MSESIQIEDPLLGRLLDGKYHIESRIGIGGMATVYLARRKHIGDRVAVKVLNTVAPMSEVDLRRFELEARIAAKIKHPNIVSVFDFGSTRDGLMYLVMELLEGSSLEKEMEQKGALGLERTLELLQPICEAVNAAHAEGLIHRDLKPSNILLHRLRDGSEVVKVVDFGVAKLTNINDTAYKGRLTKTGYLVGTPHYMSPEQIREQNVTSRCDIYSLGVITYEMLTGRLPFDADNVIDLLLAHIEKQPPGIRSIRPEIPEGVDEAVLRALEKEPEKRHASARELFQQIYSGARKGRHTSEFLLTPRALPRLTTGHHHVQPSTSQRLRRAGSLVYDSLTDVYNNAYISLRLDSELQNCKSKGERISIILLGIDGFKLVNQRYGFSVGDRILSQFSKWLTTALPKTALIGRYQGDEFLLVLPGTEGKSALKLGTELLKRAETECVFELDSSEQKLQVKFSAAVAQFPGDGESGTELITQATTGLKYAKSRGGARIEWVKHVQTLLEASPNCNWNAFIGRKSELERLNREFERSLMNQSRSIFITGGIGIGKKRLAEEFRRKLSGKDVTLLRGRFHQSSQAAPCKTIYDGLHSYLAPMIDDSIDQVREWFGSLADKVIADFHESEGFSSLVSALQAGASQRYLLFDYLTKVFWALAQQRPLVLLLEDLQWADEISLELLAYLLSQSQQRRLLLIGCARTEGLGDKHPVRIWLRNASRSGSETLELQPFTLAEVESYLETVFARSIFPPSFIRLLHRETGGNPYFVSEITRCMLDEGKITFSERVWRCEEVDELILPRAVQDVVEALFGKLEPDTLELLQRASVLGQRFSFELLQAVVSIDEDTLLGHIDAALKAQVIVEVEGVDEELYEFSYGLLRRSLYSKLNRRLRRSLHSAAADALEQLYPRAVSERLEHLHACSNHELSFRCSLEAAQAAWQTLDVDRALRYYSWGADSAERLGLFNSSEPDVVRRLTLLELGYGEMLVVVGKAEAALEHFELAMKLSKNLDPALEARCLTGLAEASEALGRYSIALEYCKLATAIADKLQDHATRAACMCVTGVALDRLGEHDRAVLELEKAADYARANNQPKYEAKALQEMAYMLIRSGKFRRSLGAIDQAYLLARRAGAPILEMIALSIKGQLLLQQRAFEQAKPQFEQALRMASKLNRRRGQAIELYNCAELQRLQGNYRQAIDCIIRAMELSREIGERQFESLSRVCLGLILKASDSHDQALETLKLSLQQLRDAGNKTAAVGVLVAIAEIYLERQSLADAKFYAQQAHTLAEQLSANTVLWQSYYVLGRIYLAEGHREDAYTCLRSSVACIEQICEDLTVDRDTFLADKREVYALLVKLVEENDSHHFTL